MRDTMIRFALKCDNDHSFESWFQSSDAFDGLRAAGLVTCPLCQSARVSKTLMAPRVRPSRKAATGVRAPQPAQPVTNTPDAKLVEAIRALRAHIEENSDYVGENFVREARAMHDGETPHRPIHGEARADEARKLIEDGIPTLPLPFIPRQKTN